MAGYKICPCCGLQSYEFTSGWQGEEPIEPDTGNCFVCGFNYSQHWKRPERQQIKSYKLSFYHRGGITIEKFIERIIGAVEGRLE